jgi:hypothetical protein
MEDRRGFGCFEDLLVLEMHMRYQLFVGSRFPGRVVPFVVLLCRLANVSSASKVPTTGCRPTEPPLCELILNLPSFTGIPHIRPFFRLGSRALLACYRRTTPR